MFEYVALNELGILRTQRITELFEMFLKSLTMVPEVPEGREFSIVKTKLEEACFFAKKAVSRDPENHKG